MDELDKLRTILGPDRPLYLDGQPVTKFHQFNTPAPRLRSIGGTVDGARPFVLDPGEQILWEQDITQVIQMVTPETPVHGLPIERSWAELVPPRSPAPERYDELDLVAAGLAAAFVGMLFGFTLGVLW